MLKCFYWQYLFHAEALSKTPTRKVPALSHGRYYNDHITLLTGLVYNLPYVGREIKLRNEAPDTASPSCVATRNRRGKPNGPFRRKETSLGRCSRQAHSAPAPRGCQPEIQLLKGDEERVGPLGRGLRAGETGNPCKNL